MPWPGPEPIPSWTGPEFEARDSWSEILCFFHVVHTFHAFHAPIALLPAGIPTPSALAKTRAALLSVSVPVACQDAAPTAKLATEASAAQGPKSVRLHKPLIHVYKSYKSTLRGFNQIS